jgi:hypothetical protein
MYNLEETGELDATTLNAMAAPRCGMPDTKPVVYTVPSDPDVGKRYFVPGVKCHVRNACNIDIVKATFRSIFMLIRILLKARRE